MHPRLLHLCQSYVQRHKGEIETLSDGVLILFLQFLLLSFLHFKVLSEKFSMSACLINCSHILFHLHVNCLVCLFVYLFAFTKFVSVSCRKIAQVDVLSNFRRPQTDAAASGEIPMYQKEKIYNGLSEFCFEELRAIKYWKQKKEREAEIERLRKEGELYLFFFFFTM